MKKEKMDYLKIAKYLLKLEKRAYKLIKNKNINVQDKNTNDIVTNYDLAIEKFLIHELNNNYPDVKILSEEFNAKENINTTYFTIDPIDGTKNFANGNENWGIQIALIEDSEPVACAIFMPFFGSYIAGKGCGAYKNGKRMFTVSRELKYTLAEVNHFNLDSLNKNARTTFINSILEVRDCGASCKIYVSLAEGSLGLKLDYGKCNLWDIMPGILLSNEAGCITKKYRNWLVTATSEENLNQVIDILKIK